MTKKTTGGTVPGPGVRCSNDVAKTTGATVCGPGVSSNDMAKTTGATVPGPDVRCSNDMAKTTVCGPGVRWSTN